MTLSGVTKIAGVAGWPINHSLSPFLMKNWIDETGLDASYAPFAIQEDNAIQVFKSLAKTSMKGINVTLPLKIKALEASDNVSETAQTIGAANLLTFQNGQISADNTDAAGFLYSIDQAKIDLRASKALILGAGGASRAILYALKQAGTKSIQLCNRTRSKADKLIEELASDHNTISWEEKNEALKEANIIINTTSMGMKGLNDLVLDWTDVLGQTVVVDIVYTPVKTKFLSDAESVGALSINGLGMLIGQARPSFKALFGTDASNTPDLQTLLISKLVETP